MLLYCFCFIFWFFDHKACGILVPWSGIKSTCLILEGEVFTTGPPGNSQSPLHAIFPPKILISPLSYVPEMISISTAPRIMFQQISAILYIHRYSLTSRNSSKSALFSHALSVDSNRCCGIVSYDKTSLNLHRVFGQ